MESQKIPWLSASVPRVFFNWCHRFDLQSFAADPGILNPSIKWILDPPVVVQVIEIPMPHKLSAFCGESDNAFLLSDFPLKVRPSVTLPALPVIGSLWSCSICSRRYSRKLLHWAAKESHHKIRGGHHLVSYCSWEAKNFNDWPQSFASAKIGHVGYPSSPAQEGLP